MAVRAVFGGAAGALAEAGMMASLGTTRGEDGTVMQIGGVAQPLVPGVEVSPGGVAMEKLPCNGSPPCNADASRASIACCTSGTSDGGAGTSNDSLGNGTTKYLGSSEFEARPLPGTSVSKLWGRPRELALGVRPFAESSNSLTVPLGLALKRKDPA